MGGKLIKGRGTDLRTLHEALSMATIVAIVVHALALLGDTFMHPSLADITIPFVSSYKTLWMTMGIVGGWMMIILGLSFYARGAHRPAALAQAAPLHRAGLGPRPRSLARRRHRRRQAVVPRGHGDRRDPGRGAARRPHVAQATRAAGRRPRGGGAMSDGILIAGGGLAGQRCAETLRRAGYEGRVRDGVRRAARPPTTDRRSPRPSSRTRRPTRSSACARRRGTATTPSRCCSAPARRASTARGAP
jgi:hypothetical protein